MEKELRLPFVSFLCGLGVLIALMAPKLALIPFVTGIVLLINKQLLFKEWYRLEVQGASILRIVNRWLDFEIDQIVIGAFVLTVAQIVFPVLSVMPGLRLDQQQAYAWVFYALLVIELAVIFIVPLGHVMLRIQLMSQSARIVTFDLVVVSLSVGFLILGALAPFVTGPILVIGFSIFALGLHKDGETGTNEIFFLAIVLVMTLVVARMFTGTLATGIAVAEMFFGCVFAFFGGFLLFRNRVLDQGKFEVR